MDQKSQDSADYPVIISKNLPKSRIKIKQAVLKTFNNAKCNYQNALYNKIIYNKYII